MRFKRLFRRKRVVVPVIATVAVALGAGFAFAGGGPNGNVYNACLTNGGSIINVTIESDPAPTCNGNSIPISWNAVGQQGPQGVQGIPGPPGPPGAGANFYERSDTRSVRLGRFGSNIGATASCDGTDYPVSMKREYFGFSGGSQANTFISYPVVRAIGGDQSGAASHGLRVSGTEGALISLKVTVLCSPTS